MNKKVMTIVGARPQFIKAAAVSREFVKSGLIDEYIVHTGQHYDFSMSDIFFQELGIPTPNKNLKVQGGNHGEQTGEMLKLIEQEILFYKPDVVMVYGDTNSTLAGALAASKLHVPLAHVEAGLRSFNKKMPEEINRILTDHVSDLLFIPTQTAEYNLRQEGIVGNKVQYVGDVMFDAMLYYSEKSGSKAEILDRLNLRNKQFAFVTIHRAENTNDVDRLLSIFNQLELISQTLTLILPLHPRTKNVLALAGFELKSKNFHIIDPQGYLETILLQRHSKLIITDSGGVQKEAFFNKKLCITVRQETEWTELVENGYNFLADPIDKLSSLVFSLLNENFISKTGFSPYGDGIASKKITEGVLNM